MKASLARLAVALVVMAACLWAIQQAATIGWASFQSTEARALQWQWKMKPKSVDQLDWNRAREQYLLALALDPENPEYHEGFANLYLARLAGMPGDRARMRPYFSIVLQHYLRAATLRPTRPYVHAGIALVKVQMGELDGDFRRALALASHYGPWEAAIHEFVIKTGYGNWAALGEPERELVRGTLQRAQQHRPKETAALFAGIKAWLPQCAELGADLRGACAGATMATMPQPGVGKERQP